ncbi:MAG TPA: hypothetical protein VFT66_15740 [Roseiflexaceae bacterium]|nr:hypothetical protein [Roseiflexaceae bacterium]
MPDQDRPTSLTDRELLLLLEQRVRLLDGTIKDSYHDMREQMSRSNARIEQMAQQSQQFEQRMNRSADITLQAQGDARHARVELGKLATKVEEIRADVHNIDVTLFGDKDEERVGLVQQVRGNARILDEYKYYFKVVGAIFVIIQILVVPIFLRLIQQYLGL